MAMKMMKIFKVLAAVAVATLLWSCNKVSDNGDFDGQWQLMTVTTPSGEETAINRCYYCIMLHTANLRASGHATLTANMTYVKKESVTFEFPYASPEDLYPWGLYAEDFPGVDQTKNGVTVTFKVNSLTSDKLIMTSPSGNVLSLRKF